MAIWNRNKVPPANLNAGQQYNAEDWTSEQTFNAANNNAFYAVDYAEALGDTPDTSEVGNIGTPTVTLIDNVKTIDGTPKTFKKFKFSNLKGDRGGTVARFVIGTSTSGWTTQDCDYLCDGTADQVEINTAIAALPAGGGEIIILDGTYNITAKINLNKSNVTISGNGNSTILKKMYDSSYREGVITLTSVNYCKIKDLQIDGNKATYDSLNNIGIFLDSSNNNTVTGNICNSNAHGIYLDSSNNNTITGNPCNNNISRGIYLASSSNNTITGNTYNNNTNHGIFLITNSNNNTITGNTCNNNATHGILLNSSNNNTITGNTCTRGTGLPDDYTAGQYTIRLNGTDNNYNLIAINNCMGKAVSVGGGTGNSVYGNKWDAGNDLP